MKNKIPILFFILVYFNQGFFDLSSQVLYYLTRETWLLSATTIGVIGFVTSLAWYLKPCWGIIVDRLNRSKGKIRKFLTINYSVLLCLYFYIIIFGLNFWSLLIILTLINVIIGMNDVANDATMVVYEQKYKLQGKLQSVQWTALGVAGLIVAILGAWIADKFTTDVGIKLCYGIAGIVPLVTLIYLKFGWQETSIPKNKTKTSFAKIIQHFKNPQIFLAMCFIACFQLCPNFGTPLMIKTREELLVNKMFLGYLGATGTVLGIVGYLLYYWKFHKFPLKKLLYFTIIFSAITNLFYLYIPNQWFLFAYNIAFGAFGGITFLTLLAFFATLVPKGSEGLIYSCITALSNLCSRGGSVLGGIIYDNLGYNWTVIASTVLTLMCLFFLPKLQERNN
jgi:MFS family permease